MLQKITNDYFNSFDSSRSRSAKDNLRDCKAFLDEFGNVVKYPTSASDEPPETRRKTRSQTSGGIKQGVKPITSHKAPEVVRRNKDRGALQPRKPVPNAPPPTPAGKDETMYRDLPFLDDVSSGSSSPILACMSEYEYPATGQVDQLDFDFDFDFDLDLGSSDHALDFSVFDSPSLCFTEAATNSLSTPICPGSPASIDATVSDVECEEEATAVTEEELTPIETEDLSYDIEYFFGTQGKGLELESAGWSEEFLMHARL